MTSPLLIIFQKKYLTIAIVVFLVYFFIYLAAAQFLTISESKMPQFFIWEVAPNWHELIFKQRAPFLFESVAAIYFGRLKLFISPLNIVLSIALSILVALNLTLSYYKFRVFGLRGIKGFASLLGTLPALLGGMACCVPVLILIIGLQFTATLASLWSFLIPLSFILLIISLWWILRESY